MLLPHLATLTHLDCQHCSLRDEDIAAIADRLPQLALAELRLSHNEIGLASVAIIAQHLRSPLSLTKMELTKMEHTSHAGQQRSCAAAQDAAWPPAPRHRRH
jgi:hypothetical protein